MPRSLPNPSHQRPPRGEPGGVQEMTTSFFGVLAAPLGRGDKRGSWAHPHPRPTSLTGTSHHSAGGRNAATPVPSLPTRPTHGSSTPRLTESISTLGDVARRHVHFF